MSRRSEGLLHNRLLRRYWFVILGEYGVGITAFSLEDARSFLADLELRTKPPAPVTRIIEDVDISALDPNHVRPNMNPPNFRGIWYPMLNDSMRA